MFQNKEERIALLKELSLAFGPTGSEMPTAELIIEKLNALGYDHKLDRLGNVTVYVPSGKENAKKLKATAKPARRNYKHRYRCSQIIEIFKKRKLGEYPKRGNSRSGYCCGIVFY